MINDDKQMADLSPEKQALKALLHVAIRIHEDPFVGYYLGYGSQAFALVTEALATLTSQDVVKVRTDYAPTTPRDPRYEPRGDEPRPPEFRKDDAKLLRSAVQLLEQQANADFLAAACNLEHRTFALMQSGQDKDRMAGSLFSLAVKIEEGLRA